MNLIIVRFIYIITALLISFLLFKAYKKGGNKGIQTRNLGIFFLLFAGYRFFLTTPSFVDNSQTAAMSYNVAVAIFFIMITVALKIVLSLLKINEKIIKTLISTLLLIGAGVVVYQTVNLNLPEITKSGIVLWNVSPITFHITGISGFIVAIVWVYFYSIKFMQDSGILHKAKNFSIMLMGLFLGLSSIFHFSPSESDIKLSFLFSFLSIVAILIALLFHYLGQPKVVK